jgi:hypothetical protein
LKRWLLITDWPVEDAESAERIFRMYRQRWAVEDRLKFTKDVLGWEEVHLLDLEGIRTLLGLGGCWLPLRAGDYSGVGRGAAPGSLGRMGRTQGQPSGQDRADSRIAPHHGHALDPGIP